MTLVLDLKPEVERALRSKADASGFPVSDYVNELIRKDVSGEPTLDERLAPVRDQFEKSGMTEEELDDFFNDIRKKVYQERKANMRT